VAPGISVTAEDDPIGDLVTEVPMSTPVVSFNARVDKDHSTSVSGGLTVVRLRETADIPSSRMSLEPVTLTATDLFGFAFATAAVLQDSMRSFVALLNRGFSDEMTNKLVNERVNGGGLGQFLGVLKSPCLITVDKEAGQTAGTIVSQNVDKAMERVYRFWRAAWLANPTVRPQLKGLVRAVGSGGSAEPYLKTDADGQERLDGRPIYYSEFCPVLGQVGDLILGNWSEFLEGTYQPMQQTESVHVRYMANESAFKFWLRNAGAPWWKSVLTPKNGADTRSPFVALQAR
jgi:HK97 family phage major capsid protein